MGDKLKKIIMILSCVFMIFTYHLVKPKQEVDAFVVTPALIGTVLLATLAIGGTVAIATNEDLRQGIADGVKHVVTTAPQYIYDEWTTVWELTKLEGKIAMGIGSTVWDWIQTQAVNDVMTNMLQNAPVVTNLNQITTLVATTTGFNHRSYYKLENPFFSNGYLWEYISFISVESEPNKLATGHYDVDNVYLTHSALIKMVEQNGFSKYGMYPADLALDANNIVLGINRDGIDADYAHSIDNWADEVSRNLDPVFENAVAQGLNIDLEKLPFVGEAGETLRWNPLDKVFEDVGTKEVYLGDPVLDLDNIGTVTDAQTGDIVRDGSRARVVARDHIGDLTDIITGDYVGTVSRDIPLITTFPLDKTDAPPTDYPADPPIPSAINWEKLKLSGELFTTIFPFSLPFDIYKALDASFSGIQNPDFSGWYLPIHVGSKTENIHIKIPQEFLNFLPYWQGIMLIMFDIGLIYATRKLFGGAS